MARHLQSAAAGLLLALSISTAIHAQSASAEPASTTGKATAKQEAEKPLPLKILEAIYGDLPDGNTAVVTEKVAKLVKDNKLQFEVGNDLFGDPAEQVGKKLRVKYELGGKASEVTIDEGETLLLPKPKLVGELKILTAKYGDVPNGDTADVTSQISRLVKDNGLDVMVDNETFGDPAPGVFKRLRVEYQIGDIKLSKSAYESGRLQIKVPSKETAKNGDEGKDAAKEDERKGDPNAIPAANLIPAKKK